MNSEIFKRFCEDLWTHVQHAKNKHPNRYVLPGEGMSEDKRLDMAKTHDTVARIYRGDIDETAPLADFVVKSEMQEFLSELCKRDIDRTWEEALDLCASVFRATEQTQRTMLAADCTTLRVGIDLSVSAFMEFDHRATERGMSIQEYIKELVVKGVKAEKKEEEK